MPTIPLTLRTIKGSKLTFNELDSNFLALRNAINTVTASDTFVTGGTYNPSTFDLNFTGNNGFNPFDVDVSGLIDVFVSGGTYNPITGCATFVTNSGTTFDVCGFLTGATGTAEVVWTGGSAGNYSVKQITDTTTDATGDYAVAIGRDTRASALASFAGGRNSVAAGQYSFAFGVTVSGTSTNSVAFGEGTLASGGNTLVSGRNNIVEGTNSFAHGDNNSVTSSNSFASGNNNNVSGDNSTASGIGTTASGYYSTASGGYTTASGDYTTASGFDSVASGFVSHAEGNSTASGQYSHSEGISTTASGDYSHSEGRGTIASGIGSHAEGYNATASGDYSHAEGGYSGKGGGSNTAFGLASHAEGANTVASGRTSHTEGFGTITLGANAHAEGATTTASGYASHSEGSGTIASGNQSHAEGQQTTASGDKSHAEGYFSTASGYVSHAEGGNTTASGNYSHSEGASTTASGYGSHAQGEQNTASGSNSHAGGFSSTASGSQSFIHSQNSLVTGNRSVVLGGQNLTGATADTVYVPFLNVNNVGTGTSVNNLGVDSSGNVVVGTTGAPSFTGNTSGDCISDIYVTNLYGCSPLHIEPSGLNDVYMVENGGSVSIGTTTIYSPTGTGVRTPFQVSMGDSGIPFSGLPISTTALFESDTGNSIGLVSPTNNQIYFGTPEDVFGASIRWDYPNREFLISTNNTSGSTVFETNNGIEAARIDENGNFGIGTDTPQFTLDVAGETRLSGSGQSILTVIGSGSGSTTPLFTVQGESGELFSITDDLTGSLFSVNDASGLPVLEVFDTDIVLIGSHLAPSLNTTVKSYPPTGLSTIYSLPISAYTGGFFDYTVSNTSGARSGNIMSIFSGTSVQSTEVSTASIGSTTPITFTMSSDGVDALLQVSAATTGWEVKTIVRSI